MLLTQQAINVQLFQVFSTLASFILLETSLAQGTDTIGSVTGVVRCGAGTSVLRASSYFEGLQLVTYHWYHYQW